MAWLTLTKLEHLNYFIVYSGGKNKQFPCAWPAVYIYTQSTWSKHVVQK